MKKAALLYGLCGGILIAALRLAEYRFLVVEHSVEIYGALVAALFAGLGIWLGLTLTDTKEVVVVKEVAVRADRPFAVNDAKVQELGITPRELEILQLIASGMSTREIAGALYFKLMPGFGEKYAAYTIDHLKASGASQQAIDASVTQMQGFKQMLENPLMNAAITFTEPFPIGLLVTLISAAVLKKK